MTRQHHHSPRDHSPETDLPTLSVVVIARNEEDRIDDCLESVFAATEAFDAEVFVVDSNSTDRTVSQAAEFPATVFRIPTDDLSNPSAGRYVGTQHATGEQVLFVDGDIVVSEGWLESASELLEDRSDLAGVDGRLGETSSSSEKSVEPSEKSTESLEKSAERTDWVRGVALYDADALAEVGGFDPYLRSLEDIHLSFELSREGYRLLRLQTVVGEQVRESSSYLEPIRRWRRGFFHGVPDTLFRSASSPRLFARHVEHLRHGLTAGLWLFVGAMSVVAPPVFAGWLALSLVGTAGLVYTQGLERAYKLLVFWVFLSAAILTHEWTAPDDPDRYPVERVEQVAAGPRLE